MTYEEVNDRKREQNKNAARKYRAKKQKELETNKYEISRLEKRNTELRDMETFLADQIAFYKEMMISKVNS
uniref:BZIP domain-containing protein n=1 Tax=Panagrolaimus superbus TaxID=310955 RepID=A0A914YQR3_9BILA